MTDPPPTARKCEKLCFFAKSIASVQLLVQMFSSGINAGE